MRIILLRLLLILMVIFFMPGMILSLLLWVPVWLFTGINALDKFMDFTIDGGLKEYVDDKIEDIKENKKKKKEFKKKVSKGLMCMACQSVNNVYCPDPLASGPHQEYYIKKSFWKNIISISKSVILFVIYGICFFIGWHYSPLIINFLKNVLLHHL